jgi:2-polyprenyl-3-methyl-5-hydroxy-6-metoxy-1,4-benzoquinol methylase
VKWLQQHKDDFINVPCPACNSWDAIKSFEKYEFTYMVCNHCATMYVSPRPTPAILEQFNIQSQNYEFLTKYLYPATEENRRKKIFAPRVERLAEICKRHNISKNMLVEVGAGFGTFCEEIISKKLFERVIAIEPTPDLADSCRQKKIEVIEKPIEKIFWEYDLADVIASFEVIEHLFSPRDFIKNCSKMLKPGGIIVISCPNNKGFDLLVPYNLANTVDTFHINYFNPKSLTNLLSECKFEVLETLTPGELDVELVRKKILAGEFDVSKQLFLKHILLDEYERVGDAFQKFLIDNKLSSHMWIVAKKNYEV